MDYLVLCRCGHTVADHDGDGCFDPCECRLDRNLALESAIDAAAKESASHGARVVHSTASNFRNAQRLE